MQSEAHSGARVAFWIRVGWLHISKVIVRYFMNNILCGCMRETVTQIVWETGGGLAIGLLDVSQSMWRSGAVKEIVHRKNFDSLFLFPLAGPSYLLHKPSLNCEHRCSTDPQSAQCIVYPISWWSVQLQVNHNIHQRERESEVSQRVIYHHRHWLLSWRHSLSAFSYSREKALICTDKPDVRRVPAVRLCGGIPLLKDVCVLVLADFLRYIFGHM